MTAHPRDVATQFYELLNEHASHRLDSLCAQDFRGHAGAGANVEELKASIDGFAEAFPDVRIEVRDLVCEGDKVSAWLTYAGTHQGQFAGVPATGKKVRFAAWDLMRIDGEQIVELTMYCDLFTLMNQMGALATASPA